MSDNPIALERRCVDALAKAQGLEPHETAALPISTATGNLLDEVRAVLAEAGVAEMVEALRLVSDDYQTSEAHHPNHVLIPVATLGAARLALTKIGATQ